jgi:ribulose kinase
VQAAEETGLLAGTPVAQGGADAFVGMVGLGVVAPGSVALITGSSHLHLLQTDVPSYSSEVFGAYSDAVVPGQFTVEGGQASTGSVVNWFARHLGGGVPLAELGEAAGRVPPGSEGVMALDYWQGNRTPHVDADARGMFWGLSLHHERAHLFRALLESVCFGTEDVLRSMRAQGHDIRDMVACGGAVNSRVWMQMHADVSGTAIRTTQVPEAVTLGAAILAATGAGLHASVAEASRAMVRTAEVVEPDLAVTEQYRPHLELYLDSYAAMRPLMHRSAELAQAARR